LYSKFDPVFPQVHDIELNREIFDIPTPPMSSKEEQTEDLQSAESIQVSTL
jgi:hypothetical protein